ncbi:cellulose binding domain-containing protein [Streptomyces sp. NPDC003016]
MAGVGDTGGTPGPGPTPTLTPTPTPVPVGTCSATQRVVNAWNGGYRTAVTVKKNTGTAPVPSWIVHATLPDGQRVDTVWNGTLGGSGTAITVSNAAWNGSLSPGATTAYGFTVTGGAPPGTPQISCMVHHQPAGEPARAAGTKRPLRPLGGRSGLRASVCRPVLGAAGQATVHAVPLRVNCVGLVKVPV